jgi:phenylalanyl-tRNA synthetase beta subunit
MGREIEDVRLAFNLTYIEPDRTLTDKEVLKVRNKIIWLLMISRFF